MFASEQPVSKGKSLILMSKTGATRARPAIVTLQGLLVKSDSSYCLRPVGIWLCSGWMGDLNTALALVLIKRLL